MPKIQNKRWKGCYTLKSKRIYLPNSESVPKWASKKLQNKGEQIVTKLTASLKVCRQLHLGFWWWLLVARESYAIRSRRLNLFLALRSRARRPELVDHLTWPASRLTRLARFDSLLGLATQPIFRAWQEQMRDWDADGSPQSQVKSTIHLLQFRPPLRPPKSTHFVGEASCGLI